jgi:hypothetical protein
MDIIQTLRSGKSLTTKGRPGKIATCNCHSIYISGGNGTVQYKKGAGELEDLTPITLAPPADFANGFGDGPIWQQTDVREIIITATADCEVVLNSYRDSV